MPGNFTDDGALIVEQVISRANPVTVRSALTSNDLNEAAVYALDSGVDCTGYDVIEVEIDMTGSTAGDTFTITPLVKVEGAEAYSKLYDQRSVLAVSDAIIRKLRIIVGGNPNVNFLCNDKAGATPTIASIKVVPITGA